MLNFFPSRSDAFLDHVLTEFICVQHPQHGDEERPDIRLGCLRLVTVNVWGLEYPGAALGLRHGLAVAEAKIYKSKDETVLLVGADGRFCAVQDVCGLQVSVNEALCREVIEGLEHVVEDIVGNEFGGNSRPRISVPDQNLEAAFL